MHESEVLPSKGRGEKYRLVGEEIPEKAGILLRFLVVGGTGIEPVDPAV